MTSSLLSLLLCVSSALLVTVNAGCSRAGVPTVCTCPSGWTQRDKHCYLFVRGQVDWATAERACIAYGGNLASFHSRAEYDFLRTVVYRATGSNPRTWVGASDAVKDGNWLWSDGSRFSSVSWGAGEPNNAGGREDCMEINRNGGDYINDERCTTTLNFICAKHL
ncbi:galactose-specific lectin nattectin [Austrofundulus limnaeus]|uniref:Galactose-specific lectin nattectin n=1 Tax=Austrofundulus limnaeus TaxID=52670 RepID=A0A2I4D2P0_AUSLI|nr:PREDICTED: galactose-specific lectin nattectin-like [Austrofundulus limnaeus]